MALNDALVLQEPPADTMQRRMLRRFLRHRMAVSGLLLLAFIALYVIAGTIFFSEFDSINNNTSIALNAPSSDHLMGTDRIGRDVMARTIYGGQISLLIGIFAMVVSVTLGVLVGILSGYFGGLVDGALMRVTEAFLSIPQLLILLLLANLLQGKIEPINLLGRTLDGSVVIIVGIIGATSWMYLSRIVRSTVLTIKEQEYVLAARAVGANDFRIVLRHVLPNILAPVIVAGTLGVANAILAEAYISFLGLGVQEPTATWGSILNSSRDQIENAPWLWVYPGLLILLTVLSINFIGDGLRDAVDPRSQQ
jgi:peptide/nickel transport system permease protein